MTTPTTIEVNGKRAIVLVPELVEHLAIVDLNVIKRLAALLPQASLSSIKEEMKMRITAARTMEDYVAVLQDELSFHQSVNMIREYTPEPQQVEEVASVRAY